MKRIAFFSIPLFGHVNYGLKIAKQLQDDGYEVLYYSGYSYQNCIELKGVRFQAYSDEIEELFETENSTYNNSYMSNIEPEKLDHVDEWYNFCSHLYKINELFFEYDIHVMKKPDLVIYDSAALWGKRIGQFFGVLSIASCTPYFYPEKYARYDYAEFARLILQKDYSNNKAGRVVYMLEKAVNGSIIEPLSPTADYRFIYSVKSFQAGVEYIDENTYFVGPLIDKDDYSSVDESLFSIDTANIYIAFGSIYNNGTVFRRIYEECKDLPFNFILNIGNSVELECFDDLPPNWHVVQRINQISVLQKVQLFISHGGVNSVRESMYWGVPILVIPAEGDTLCTAKDIDTARLGVQLSIEDIELIKEKIELILNSQEIQENCNKISSEMKRAGGIYKTVEIIKNILEDEQ